MQIANTLEHCHQLWEKFSPHCTLWDEWSINECFYHPSSHALQFMHTDKSLLPLVFNTNRNRHEFFGHGLIENRTLWIADEEIETFFAAIPENTYLFDMNGEAIERILATHALTGFEQDDYRNYLRKSHEELLATFSKKSRYNFLSDLRRVENINFSIEEKKPELLESLFTFNKQRFKEESDFHDEIYIAGLRKLYLLPDIHFLVGRNEKIVAVEMIAIFKNKLYALNMASDQSISNLGKLLIWQTILLKEQFQLEEIDFLAGSDGWKWAWKLDHDKYYTFRK